MKILHIAAEVSPFVSVGGLSQVMYFLPSALIKKGHDARVFTPKYGTSKIKKRWKKKKQIAIHVPIGDNAETKKAKRGETIPCEVSFYIPETKEPPVYFIENREYYTLRENVFGYADDHTRFALLSKGALEWMLEESKKENGWIPDIIHCHDWHTGYFVELAKRDKKYKDLLLDIPIVFTIHNFKYQGNGSFKYVQKEDKDSGKTTLAPLGTQTLKKQNALKRGLIYADAINTVSQAHALEVLTPEYAEGLEDTLEKVKGKFIGILNGLDTKTFNRKKDLRIKKRFTHKNFKEARRENKKDLQKVFHLPIDASKPLIAYSGRLAQQKGWDILLETLPQVLKHTPNTQLIVLGGGDEKYRHGLQQLQREYPKRVGLHLMPDFELPRKIFAGADMLLLPSIFEPGGIVALEALRYGAVPLVRHTGGLGDIIDHFDPETKRGNGFSFVEKDPWALYGIIIEAITLYNQKNLWNSLVKNCLRCDFSWENVAGIYDIWYKQILQTDNTTRKRKGPLYSIQKITNMLANKT
ncbi:MAG: glycogen synthase [Candidatus Magasanikbacteria bacterium]|nr:glycogen synthase [Candidatus Magasanikbacteria bacterium]